MSMYQIKKNKKKNSGFLFIKQFIMRNFYYIHLCCDFENGINRLQPASATHINWIFTRP